MWTLMHTLLSTLTQIPFLEDSVLKIPGSPKSVVVAFHRVNFISVKKVQERENKANNFSHILSALYKRKMLRTMCSKKSKVKL
jgi:hypothetical protein